MDSFTYNLTYFLTYAIFSDKDKSQEEPHEKIYCTFITEREPNAKAIYIIR